VVEKHKMVHCPTKSCENFKDFRVLEIDDVYKCSKCGQIYRKYIDTLLDKKFEKIKGKTKYEIINEEK